MFKLLRKQRGFTIIEMLIAIAIVAIVGVAITVSMTQTIKFSGANNNLNTAINNVRYAGDWVSRDIRSGKSIEFSSATPLLPGSSFTITWIDIDGHLHTTTYSLDSDGSLQRQVTETESDGAIIFESGIMTAAASINNIEYSVSDEIVTLNITATVHDKSYSKDYQIALRN